MNTRTVILVPHEEGCAKQSQRLRRLFVAGGLRAIRRSCVLVIVAHMRNSYRNSGNGLCGLRALGLFARTVRAIRRFPGLAQGSLLAKDPPPSHFAMARYVSP